ncbi:radical SAM protein [Aquisphaera insulae]|uniref:radical SAM protein n=1 Tax=Aquisphaera insulae TaxID=2712864 RepID=UPI0013EB1D1F|nr:radical SAM protein [Aquisphaera insulae]
MVHLMATTNPPGLAFEDDLQELIRRVNDHPEVRLRLLGEVSSALDVASPASEERRRSLAEKVERWRYQVINHRGGRLSEDQSELTRRLDLLELELDGSRPRPPRSLQAQLATIRERKIEDAALEACLDPRRRIEDVEREAAGLTDATFGERGSTAGRRILLYAPLYLSNHCINHCLYCGFRYSNPMARDQLDLPRVLDELEILGRRDFRHILLVAGEHPAMVSGEYLAGMVRAVSGRHYHVGVEIAPQSTAGYRKLAEAGATSVTLYQETYDPERYAAYHPRGTKAWYDWRVEGPERAADAGIRRLGLGILLGLGDHVEELRALVAHGRYLLDRYPGLKLSLSLPRIHEAPQGFQPPFLIDDDTLVRSYCALRKAFPTANLVLSTRESASLRDRLARVCITQMSAGSSTSPGGYQEAECDVESRQQFPVHDQRTVEEVHARLISDGFRPLWEPEGL